VAHQGTFEERKRQDKLQRPLPGRRRRSVEVPAGRFETFKVVRETDGRDFDEYWYAPAVRWHVLWKGRRANVEFESACSPTIRRRASFRPSAGGGPAR